MTRQRLWQIARVAEGKCESCGKLREHYSTMCDECQGKWNEYQRRRQGSVRRCKRKVEKILKEKG